MRKHLLVIFLLFSFLLDSCAVVGGIFKAGVWVGMLIVLFVIGLIIWLLTRSGKS
jgi:hypothetical protein